MDNQKPSNLLIRHPLTRYFPPNLLTLTLFKISVSSMTIEQLKELKDKLAVLRRYL